MSEVNKRIFEWRRTKPDEEDNEVLAQSLMANDGEVLVEHFEVALSYLQKHLGKLFEAENVDAARTQA